MKTERVLVVLVAVSAVTLAIQGFTLYRQFARPPIPPTVREAPEGTFLDISGLPIQEAAMPR